MKEEITCDKNELLHQRQKEIEEGEEYVQFKFTFIPLPEEVMIKIGEGLEEDGDINFRKVLRAVKSYINKHSNHEPVAGITGKMASPMDMAILLALAEEACANRFSEVVADFNKEGDDL